MSAGACLRHHPRVAVRQAEADTALGWSLLESGALPAATTAFDAALARRQDLAAAHEGLGRILLSQERWPDAVERFRRALSLGPESASAGVSLGNALARAGDRKAALEAWASVLEQQPGHREALLNRAASLMAAGRGREALPYLKPLSGAQGTALPADQRRLVMTTVAELEPRCSGIEGTGAIRSRP